MIKTIIFDFNGIFGDDSDDWEGYKGFVKQAGLSVKKLSSIIDSYWPKISIGKQNLIDFMQGVSEASANKVSKEKLLQTYLGSTRIDREVLDFARGLKKKGLKLIVLSNETKEAMDYKIKKFNLKEIFDELYGSAHIGMTKRNPDSFRLVINKHGLNPKETLFIDDRAENIEMAMSLGITGILYRNLRQLKKELKQYID